jgi:hypothetical protein
MNGSRMDKFAAKPHDVVQELAKDLDANDAKDAAQDQAITALQSGGGGSSLRPLINKTSSFNVTLADNLASFLVETVPAQTLNINFPANAPDGFSFRVVSKYGSLLNNAAAYAYPSVGDTIDGSGDAELSQTVNEFVYMAAEDNWIRIITQ